MSSDTTSTSRIRLWILLSIIIIVVGIIIGKPFVREQDQLRTLRTIGEDEQQTNQAAAGVRDYVSEEKTLKDIDRSLMDFQSATMTP